MRYRGRGRAAARPKSHGFFLETRAGRGETPRGRARRGFFREGGRRSTDPKGRSTHSSESPRDGRGGAATTPSPRNVRGGALAVSLRARNNGGATGACLLAGALLLAPATLLKRGHPGLETLALCRSGVGAKGARALAAALFCEPALTQLDLSGNALEGAGIGRKVKEKPSASRARRRRRNLLFRRDERPVSTDSCGGGHAFQRWRREHVISQVLRVGLQEPPAPPPLASTPASAENRRGGLASLARALEATTTLRRLVHDDDAVARYRFRRPETSSLVRIVL